jgi:hypothetical protein
MADGLRFFQDGAFDPDLNLTSAMGEAFERACKSLTTWGNPTSSRKSSRSEL